ncbi:MAG TPA: chromosome segregation protein SMC [Steroidobacteraceae bacterium]|jgi:chromosome segregation protein|nr:chromosome segregation protein SMC [Steroidobacteraceae bacterium]
MRLTKLKIAGFKSFVDPTTVTFPSSLTGVVGPNGCGKSNIIDAVRWVMGEISAKHLRGESMADVIFNGSSSRKPLGNASVELVFDNSEGKIGGPYANYNEVALRRAVSRDGSSDYYINGLKVRRKDITQLFLGTGLGTRSYAIIEQGMISRIIEARPDDLRAFLEEAAGISRYKERRRETESRIGHTRENLDRLNDLREEVEKQIRHLQRQAATARRYQTLKEDERKLFAELLVLRLQSLDAEAGTRDAATSGCETAMQSVLADLREAEARIERIRADQSSKTDALSAIQARFYEAGAEVTRIEQSIEFTRELRQRQRSDLEQIDAQAAELARVVQLDRVQLESLQLELSTMVPALDAAHDRERIASVALESSEHALASWQQSWDKHAQAVASGQRETQVERARIEQLESQQRRLLQQQQRLEAERTAFAQLQPPMALETLSERADTARSVGEQAAAELQTLLAEISATRDREREQSQGLNALRTRLQKAQGEQVSTEALQQAALGKASGKVTQWLKSQSLDRQPRVAQQLRVDRGWERAVETVLGSYLEAVCVDGLDSVTDLLASFDGGYLAVVSTTEGANTVRDAASLQAKVQGTGVLASVLSSVYTAESLADALKLRRQLKGGESVVTRDGIWLGNDWLRVSRDADPHTGVIEREETLREIRAQVVALENEVQEFQRRLDDTRERVREHEDRRERLQTDVNRLHREHLDRRAELNSAQARTAEAARRLSLLETELADVHAELARSENELRESRGRMETAIDALAALEPQRMDLEQERERLRAALSDARAAAAAAQQHARELAVQVESRRSSHASLITTLARLEKQLEDLGVRQLELAAQLADGEAPLAEAQVQLERELQLRAGVEAELRAARIASDELDALLREHDAERMAVDQRLQAARTSLDEARLAAQQVRVRRESVAEQLTATNYEFSALAAQIAPDAAVEVWESQLEETKGKIERLGQVNLAAIGEFKEQSERKEYLDRQCKDLTDALETLESAMRKIDRETRTRFQDTFDRVNAGLKEKFPRLFGGGHAYLELTGEESTAAGVSVMARPPGKRNSTISQLSGGEKALTAVALVFAIFDLNPAPFCLLDEVDAPLDENNVGRFCDIVREMSRSVQFIFITHNKSTMEMASQLVGVTMNEPGVSRLVSVDVDEAVRMAAM